MCHQSVGLIQGQIEKSGIATISTTVVPYVTRNMLVPRAAYIRFPIGSPIGEPDDAEQQLTVLRAIFDAFEVIDEPGTTVELPFRWRRVSPAIIDENVADLSSGYVIAKECIPRINDRFNQLFDACEEFVERMAAAVDDLDDEATQPKEKVLMQIHVERGRELLDLLDKPVRDQVMYPASRYYLIQIAHEGRFV